MLMFGGHRASHQNGRSMIEMIGVLAVVGVLSMEGISMFSRVMEKIAINDTLSQLSSIVQNIHTAYHSQHNFLGFDNEMAIKSGIIPSTMVRSHKTIHNLFGGEVKMRSVSWGKGFVLIYNDLPRDACIQIASASLDFEKNGLQYLMISPSGYRLPKNFPSTLDNGEYRNSELPISPAQAAKDCACRGKTCGIAYFFQ